MQRIWTSFVKERTLSLDVQVAATRSRSRRANPVSHTATPLESPILPAPTIPSNESPQGTLSNFIDLSGGNQLHVYANDEIVQQFRDGYKKDCTFAPVLT